MADYADQIKCVRIRTYSVLMHTYRRTYYTVSSYLQLLFDRIFRLVYYFGERAFLISASKKNALCIEKCKKSSFPQKLKKIILRGPYQEVLLLNLWMTLDTKLYSILRVQHP
jgi:hypothetical protein